MAEWFKALKICYPQGCVGSSPTTGTMNTDISWCK